MKSLQNSAYTKVFKLLDTALLFALVPIVLIIKPPMLLFVFIEIFFIYTRRNFQLCMVFLGLSSVLFSSFFLAVSTLGSLSWFVELIINLLLLGIILQRMTRKSNFYLLISPFLLMVLGLFFHTSILWLFYSILELFVFTALFLLYYTQRSFFEGVKLATMLFFISLPLIILLFLFFPRISFEKGEFGFKGDSSAISGHDGQMHLGSKALEVLSDRKVMEVEFLDTFPNPSQLYFRGSVLYEKEQNSWVEPTDTTYARSLTQKADIISYKVVLQPHYKHYIYTLDMPLQPIKNSTLSAGYTLLSEKNVVEEIRYEMRSALSYRLEAKTGYDTKSYNKEKNPQTQAYFKRWQHLNKEQKLTKLNDLFRSQKLTYTLSPPSYDMQNFTDSFLFSQKSGYCVHFASAYAQAARMLGLDSRVVTGYLGKYENKVENYLIIKQKDAHAWVEIFTPKQGWVRVDPTAFAVQDLTQPQTTQQKQLQRYSLEFNYLKYKIQTWVLHYNYLTQQNFFKQLLTDNSYLFQFLAFIAFLLLLGAAVFFTLKNTFCKDKLECTMQKLLKKLEKRGIVWDKRESLHRFLLKNGFKKIDSLYIKLKFSKEFEKKDLKTLQESVKKV